MKLVAYLGFRGNCREAFDYYAKVLGGKIIFRMTYGESPMANEYSESKDKIMHNTLEIPGGDVLQGADAPPGRGTTPAGFSVCVAVKDAAEGKKIFDALANGGQVQMAFEKTFWSPGFGMCIDQFQVPWMVNTEGQMPQA
jgi:PhnB protein